MELPFKTYGNPPASLVKACLRHAGKIDSVGDEGEDGYWIVMKAGYWNPEYETMCIHEWTVKSCLAQLPAIAFDPRPEDKR